MALERNGFAIVGVRVRGRTHTHTHTHAPWSGLKDLALLWKCCHCNTPPASPSERQMMLYYLNLTAKNVSHCSECYHTSHFQTLIPGLKMFRVDHTVCSLVGMVWWVMKMSSRYSEGNTTGKLVPEICHEAAHLLNERLLAQRCSSETGQQRVPLPTLESYSAS